MMCFMWQGVHRCCGCSVERREDTCMAKKTAQHGEEDRHGYQRRPAQQRSLRWQPEPSLCTPQTIQVRHTEQLTQGCQSAEHKGQQQYRASPRRTSKRTCQPWHCGISTATMIPWCSFRGLLPVLCKLDVSLLLPACRSCG